SLLPTPYSLLPTPQKTSQQTPKKMNTKNLSASTNTPSPHPPISPPHSRLPTPYSLILIAGASLLLSTPALATSPNQSNNPIANILEQASQKLNQIQSFLDETLDTTLEAISQTVGTDLQAAIDQAIGQLGLPDPETVRQGIEDSLSVSNSPVYSGDLVSNELDRQITRAQASTVFSTSGQQQLKQELQGTQQSVQSVQQSADAAQTEVITQNVMKQIAQQNAQQAAILGALRQDSIDAAKRQELTNLNLTNISRAVDGQNQAQQQEKVGAGFETLQTAALGRLF
ncbi:MAG: hypothetical protein WA919_06190, partial [Coleofasciculaceae cyanobacterium]